MKIRLQKSCPVGIDKPKPSAKIFVIQKGTYNINRLLAGFSRKGHKLQSTEVWCQGEIFYQKNETSILMSSQCWTLHMTQILNLTVRIPSRLEVTVIARAKPEFPP